MNEMTFIIFNFISKNDKIWFPYEPDFSSLYRYYIVANLDTGRHYAQDIYQLVKHSKDV